MAGPTADNQVMSRRFQFSLRTLLMLTAVFGGPCAWVAHNGIVVRERKAMREVFPTGKYCCHEEWCVAHREQTLPWLRRVFGDEPVNALHYIPDLDRDGSELRRVRSLFPESEIFGQPK
jgi:hypothetical protein